MSKRKPKKVVLEVSEWNRPIVWEVCWSWYGGQATGSCMYSTKAEAIKHAIWAAMGNVKDWSKFPSRGSYPYEDRDGNEEQQYTPVFRVTWDDGGSGFAEVYRCEVESQFQAANNELVEEIWQQLYSKK